MIYLRVSGQPYHLLTVYPPIRLFLRHNLRRRDNIGWFLDYKGPQNVQGTGMFQLPSRQNIYLEERAKVFAILLLLLTMGFRRTRLRKWTLELTRQSTASLLRRTLMGVSKLRTWPSSVRADRGGWLASICFFVNGECYLSRSLQKACFRE